MRRVVFKPQLLLDSAVNSLLLDSHAGHVRFLFCFDVRWHHFIVVALVGDRELLINVLLRFKMSRFGTDRKHLVLRNEHSFQLILASFLVRQQVEESSRVLDLVVDTKLDGLHEPELIVVCRLLFFFLDRLLMRALEPDFVCTWLKYRLDIQRDEFSAQGVFDRH